jgi:hypothetical protein
MNKITININPTDRKYEVEIKENISIKLDRIIKNSGKEWGVNIDAPEIGLLGFGVTCSNGKTYFVNDNTIILKHKNLFQVYNDEKKEANEFIMKLLSKTHFHILRYYIEVKKYGEKAGYSKVI